jgi:phage tail-like protein
MSIPVELPALYLDDTDDSTTVGISVENTIPEVGSVDAPVDTDIQLDIISTDAAIVDESETQVWINGELAFDAGVFQTGYDGPNSIAELLAVPPGQLLLDGDMEFAGAQLLTDGDMEAVGVGAWTAYRNAILTKETTAPYEGIRSLRVAYNGINDTYAAQSILTNGKTYRVRGWAKGDGTVRPYVYVGVVSVDWVGTTSTSWQYFDITAVADDARLGLLSKGGSGYCEFDYVTVTEDCPDWTAGNGALMSKETTTPHGGSQVIRITYNGTPDPLVGQTVMTIGRCYRAIGWARGDGTGVPKVYDGTTLLWTGTSSTSWQSFDETFTATGTELRLYNIASAASYADYDDVTLSELHDLRIVIDPTIDFDSEETVTVRVVSETEGGSYTVDYSYSFITEDIVVPTLLSAQATGPFTIRLTFSEDMLAESATGVNDALNPSNHAFEYLPESDRIAAVAVYSVSVAQVSGAVFDVTVDMEPTFWKTYQAQCGEIADDSSNANILDYDSRTADFSSWAPPYWPARRRFDLWSMMSDDDRRGDETIGDLERLISAYQDSVDVMLWDIDAEQFYHDIDKAPEWAVDAMLADLGNPFQLELTLERKRKLLAVLVEIYQEKGTDEGIVDVARFFLGIEITSVTEINIDTWVLGESELGVDTDLGPSGEAELYTFWLNVDRTLTDQERRDLQALVEYMKPAHTHYLIIEPVDPEHVDHVELGLSELGFNFDLH